MSLLVSLKNVTFQENNKEPSFVLIVNQRSQLIFPWKNELKKMGDCQIAKYAQYDCKSDHYHNKSFKSQSPQRHAQKTHDNNITS